MYKGISDTYLKTKRWLQAVSLLGTRYQCSFCGWKFRQMASIGHDFAVIRKFNIVGSGLRFGRCPKCFSSDRERLMHNYFKLETDIFINFKRILHIAPEPNLHRVFTKAKNIDYISGDKFCSGYSYPSGVIEMDITNLHYENETFDLIICNHVLEHIENDHSAISEIFRVLRKGGSSILQVPISYNLKQTIEDPTVISPEDRLNTFGQRDHVRIYGIDYLDRLEYAGFQVTVLDFYNLYPQLSNRVALNPDEKIILAYK